MKFYTFENKGVAICVVRKNASTSLSQSLLDSPHQMRGDKNLRQLSRLKVRGFEICAIVRNPLARLYSGWSLFKRTTRGTSTFWGVPVGDGVSFERFLQAVVERADPENHNEHIKAQHLLLGHGIDGQIIPNRLVPFESLPHKWDALRHHLERERGLHLPPLQHLNPSRAKLSDNLPLRVVDMARKHMRAEYEALGYLLP